MRNGRTTIGDNPRGMAHAFDRVVGLPQGDRVLRAELIDMMMLRPLGVLTASLGFVMMSVVAWWMVGSTWAAAWMGADVILTAARFVPALRAWRRQERVPEPMARVILALASAMFVIFGLGCAASYLSGISDLRIASTIAVMALLTGLATRWAALPRLGVGMTVIVSAPMAVAMTTTSGFVALFFIVLAAGSAVLTIQNNRVLRAMLAAKRQAQRLARTDVLTNLLNRAGLESVMEDLSGTEVSLLFLDLDGFKGVNDRYGHAAGDHTLVEIGARLRAIAGEQPVARLGGDEFGIVLTGAAACTHEAVATAVREGVRQPIMLRDHGTLVSVGVSVGKAMGSLAVRDAAGLLAEADAALYAAKRRRPAAKPRALAPRCPRSAAA